MFDLNDGMLKGLATISAVILVLCLLCYQVVDKGSGQYVVLVLSMAMNVFLITCVVVIEVFKKKKKR